MNVILLEKVRNLGVLGETVNVKAGYARNYLVPQGKAVFATADNIALFEQRRLELEQKEKNSLSDAQKRAEEIQKLSIVIRAQASEEGKLYGSVTASDIRDVLVNTHQVHVKRQEIHMPEGPLYSVGTHTIDIQLHSDLIVQLAVEVVSQR